MTGMAQDRVGEGLMKWDGQAHPVEVIVVAVAAGGASESMGPGRCNVKSR